MTERAQRRRRGPLTAADGVAADAVASDPAGSEDASTVDHDVTEPTPDTSQVVRASSEPLALVVDDNDDVREMLRLSLSLAGWEILQASSGDEALVEWRASRPDVVLLDQQMKGMSGLECAAAIRELSGDARIIMFTGFLDAATTDEARRLRILPLKKDDQARLHELMNVLAGQLRESRTSVS